MFAKKAKAAAENGKSSGFIKRLRARINRGDNWLTYDLANLAPGGKIRPPAIVIVLVAKIPLPSSRNGRHATWLIREADLGVEWRCQRVGWNGPKQPIDDI